MLLNLLWHMNEPQVEQRWLVWSHQLNLQEVLR